MLQKGCKDMTDFIVLLSPVGGGVITLFLASYKQMLRSLSPAGARVVTEITAKEVAKSAVAVPRRGASCYMIRSVIDI